MRLIILILIIFTLFFLFIRFIMIKNQRSLLYNLLPSYNILDTNFLVISYRNKDFSTIDRYLSSENTYPQKIIFLGPKFLLKIKERSWQQHQIIKSFEDVIELPNNKVISIVVNNGKHKIINNVADYLLLEKENFRGK